jgi:hypothetical protein
MMTRATLRSARPATVATLCLTGALALWACDRRAAAHVLVTEIGPARLRSAAQTLRRPVEADVEETVPRNLWPPEVVRCRPERVQVSRDGVYLQLHSFFVTESGLYVQFEGAPAPPEGPGELTFRRMWEGIYWFHYAG